VQEETQAKLTEEKAKSSKLKDQIDNLLQTSPDDATSLANLYVQFSRSLAIQGEHLKAINILKDALSKDCFKSTEDPPVISLRIGLADIYLKATGLGDAEGTLKQLIEGKNFDQVPRDLKQEALEDYGHCLSKSHKFAQAQDYYTRARELKE
jgi:tetratricopeptide (TPR) repeat protein